MIPIALVMAMIVLIVLIILNLSTSSRNSLAKQESPPLEPVKQKNGEPYKIKIDPIVAEITILDTTTVPPKVINKIELDMGEISEYKLLDVCPHPGKELLVRAYTGGSGGEQEDLYIFSYVFQKDSVRKIFQTTLSYSGPDGFYQDLEFTEQSGQTQIILDGNPLRWNGETFTAEKPEPKTSVLDSIPEKQLYLVRQENSVYILKKDTSPVKISLESCGSWANSWLINADPNPLLLLLKEENGYVLNEIFLSIYQILLSRYEIQHLTTKSLAAYAEHELLYAYYVNPESTSNGINFLFYPVKTFQMDSVLRFQLPNKKTDSQDNVLFHWDGYHFRNITPFVSLNSYPNLKIQSGLPHDSIFISYKDVNNRDRTNRFKGGILWYIDEFSPLPGPELLTVDIEDGYKWHLNYKISIYGEISEPTSPSLIFSYESGYYKDSPIPHRCVFIPGGIPEMLLIVESDTSRLLPELIHADSSYIRGYTNNSVRKYIWRDQLYQIAEKPDLR
jgi:hypothetical protein